MDENENQDLPDEEDDKDSELGDDHVAVVKVIENGEDLAKKTAKNTEKKKTSPASTSKAKRPWAANSKKSTSPKDSVDLAMVQIAERVLQSPPENKEEDDEDLLFCRSIAKRMKKLSPRTKGIIRLQIEHLMFQSEFEASTNQGHHTPGIGFSPSDYTHQLHHSPYGTDYQNSSQTFSSQLHQF